MILNRQHRIRVPVRLLRTFLAKVRRRLRLVPGSFTIALVTDAQMARWNRSYRGKLRPTDVLSFSASRRPRRQPAVKKAAAKGGGFSSAAASSVFPASYLGDIAIAPAVARRNAARFGRTFVQEMQILILHGILHLIGYDHETDSGQMERFERRLRRALGLC